jgi:hypothetical protein
VLQGLVVSGCLCVQPVPTVQPADVQAGPVMQVCCAGLLYSTCAEPELSGPCTWRFLCLRWAHACCALCAAAAAPASCCWWCAVCSYRWQGLAAVLCCAVTRCQAGTCQEGGGGGNCSSSHLRTWCTGSNILVDPQRRSAVSVRFG